MKKILIIFISSTLIIILAITLAAYTPLSEGESSQEITETKISVTNLKSQNQLKVLTWNIAFAYGQGSEGVGYHQRSQKKMQERLNSMSEILCKENADLILLQEIDFSAKRTHGVDQLQFFAEKCGYPFRAYARSWKHLYVPFPYWPLKDNFGQIDSGGGILSRFPILKNQVHLMAKPKNNPWWYNLFYPFRYLQKVQVSLEGKNLWVINLHLEAFKHKNREKQAKALIKLVKQSKEKILLIGGDFNTLPELAKNKVFGSTENYKDDQTMSLINDKLPLKEVIVDEDYFLDPQSYFTFSSHKPDRRLDYIFFDNNLMKLKEAKIGPRNDLSDHFPVQAVFRKI